MLRVYANESLVVPLDIFHYYNINHAPFYPMCSSYDLGIANMFGCQ